MRIAVIDVAAENGGALSVLIDFAQKLVEIEKNTKNKWFIITSKVKTIESKNVQNIQIRWIKKSWGHRLFWEYAVLPKLLRKLEVDVILSLQNNALPVKNVPQIVYFHNVLLTQACKKYSFLKSEERMLAVYTRIIGPITRKSWNKADAIIVQRKFVREQVKKYYLRGPIYVYPLSAPSMPIENSDSKQIEGFIYPAAAAPYKNFELIVDTMRRLGSNRENIEILFTFSGNENTYAKKILQMSQGLNNIKFIGHQPREQIINKYERYGLIITSEIESYCVPIVEAMAAQTVIVAVDFPYALESINAAAYNRIYFAKNNTDSLENSMLQAMEDKKKGNYLPTEQFDYTQQLIAVVQNTMNGKNK